MKNGIFVGILVTLLYLTAVPVYALPNYTWDIDIYLGKTSALPNGPSSNPDNELAWVKDAAEGFDPDIKYLGKFEFCEPQPYYFNGFSPGFSWTYAVVKYGGEWALFQEFIGSEGPDNRLTAPGYQGPFIGGVFPKEISHVTFFGVPEPATMILLGLGLLGLGVVTRRRT